MWGGIARRGAAGVITNINTHAGEQPRKTVLIAFIVWPHVAGSRALDLCTRLAYPRDCLYFIRLVMRKRVREGNRERERRAQIKSS